MTGLTTAEIIDALRSEARFRPTVWGDTRQLLLIAADEIEQLRSAMDDVRDLVVADAPTPMILDICSLSRNREISSGDGAVRSPTPPNASTKIASDG